MKILPIIIVFFLSIAVLFQASNCDGLTAVDPEDNSEWASELAKRFSPIICLKNDEFPIENYEPAPVETIIPKALIGNMDNPLFSVDATTGNMEKYTENSYYLDIPGASPAEFERDIPKYKRLYNEAMSGLNPTVYARVTKPGVSRYTVVQYWLFYYFDEWSNLHEGDWELVELVFADLSPKELVEEGIEPEFAAYSQHQAGQRLSWAEMKLKGLILENTHPLVYVAQGSHANYFTPGQYWLICDFDDTGLESWREIRPKLIMISEKDPDNNKNQWLNFQGLWGEHLNFKISWRTLTWTTCGVNGPAWGSQGQKSERWLQPYKWADKMAVYPQVYFISFLPEFARTWPDLAIFSIFSPADIYVYDQYGNHAGLNERGEFETQIPGADYITLEGTHSKTIIIPNGNISQGYQLIIKGTNYDTIDIKVQVPDTVGRIRTKRYLEYRDIPVTPTTIAKLQFADIRLSPPPPNSESTRDNKTILEIDQNNDGIYESEVKPGTSKIVPKEQPPVITYFNTNQDIIDAGQSCTLSWEVADAIQVTINPEIGVVQPIGSIVISPIETTTYTLTAQNEAGSIHRTVQVTVKPKPIQTPVITFFSTNQDILDAGQSCTLSWDVADAIQVTINPEIGVVQPIGSIVISPIETTTYTITAQNEAGSIHRTVQVTVKQPIKYILSTSVSPPGSGSINPSGGIYDAGTQVFITASPNTLSGMKFDHWSDDASGSSPSTTITMNSDKNIIANFINLYNNNTQLLLGGPSVNQIAELNGGKIVVAEGSWDCVVVALNSLGITNYSRIDIPVSDIYVALEKGMIDAVLVAKHRSVFVPEDANVLAWGDSAIKAVTDAFPEMVVTYLQASTYSGQKVDIKGYANPE